MNTPASIEVGGIYTGKIVKILDFAAFVSLAPGRDGFLHISQISEDHVSNIHDVLSVGQEIRVKVVEIDSMNRIKVSARALEQESS